MKKALTLFGFLFLTLLSVNAQKEPVTETLISKDIKVQKFHTIDDLNDMNKGALINLYVERVKVLSSILPFAALSTQPGVTYDDLGIPKTDQNISLLQKELIDANNLYASVEKMLNLLIPYSDKSDIVWAILFFEETIKKASLGNNL